MNGRLPLELECYLILNRKAMKVLRKLLALGKHGRLYRDARD